MILQDEYDPSQLHLTKQQIWKEVTKHNKACKINTKQYKDIMSFFATLKIGSIIWTSTTGYFLVQDKKTVTVEDWNKICAFGQEINRSFKTVDVFTVRDKKGKVKDITFVYFMEKALYKDKPRTYKELNI